jgi:hypothetical protein
LLFFVLFLFVSVSLFNKKNKKNNFFFFGYHCFAVLPKLHPPILRSSAHPHTASKQFNT